MTKRMYLDSFSLQSDYFWLKTKLMIQNYKTYVISDMLASWRCPVYLYVVEGPGESLFQARPGPGGGVGMDWGSGATGGQYTITKLFYL